MTTIHECALHISRILSDHLELERNRNSDHSADQNTDKLIAFKSNAKVLVVEDDLVSKKIISAQLAKYPIHIDTASDGEEAKNLLSNNQYDLIFMDL
jgi:PleD family two-component response regulator